MIKKYKEDKGIKGFLAKMASPSLGALKKVFPVSEKTLFEVLTDSSKLQPFFTSILTDPNKRKGFERELRKFLTGDYGGSFEEFQNLGHKWC